MKSPNLQFDINANIAPGTDKSDLEVAMLFVFCNREDDKIPLEAVIDIMANYGYSRVQTVKAIKTAIDNEIITYDLIISQDTRFPTGLFTLPKKKAPYHCKVCGNYFHDNPYASELACPWCGQGQFRLG